MKMIITSLITFLVFLSPTTFAEDQKQTLEITTPWARPTANANTPGGVFFTITNHGSKTAKMINAASDIARMTHIHMTRNDGGMMTMDTVDAVSIAAGESLTFAPGGYHIMLMGLSKKLTQGDEFDLTLTFEKAGDIVIAIPVTGMMGPSAKDVP